MIDKGGPAFPEGGERGKACGGEGMSMRDYFAARAMQTLLGSEYTSYHGLHEGWQRALAHEAYLVADAMIAARQSEYMTLPHDLRARMQREIGDEK